MNMIIVKLQGGLGNQMFQYALGRNLSLIHKVPLKIDCSYLKSPNQSQRAFQLNGFRIKTEEATEKAIQSYIGPIQKIMDKFRSDSRKKRVKEVLGKFDEKLSQRGNGYFDGHWQNEKYFYPNESAIRQDFTLKNPMGSAADDILRNIRLAKNPTSIHIRRGDYVSIKKIADTHGTLPISYYKTACDKILAKFPDAHFFVSSDDMGWVRENFPKDYRVTLVSSAGITDYEELILMGSCKHNITANSTFSWWGAWLNTNQEKIVIAPKRWFNDPARQTEGLIPPSWLKI